MPRRQRLATTIPGLARAERSADVRRDLVLVTAFSTARVDRRRLLLRSPSVSSISAADAIAPIGFAMFFPANFGAEPCTGSNIDVRPG